MCPRIKFVWCMKNNKDQIIKWRKSLNFRYMISKCVLRGILLLFLMVINKSITKYVLSAYVCCLTSPGPAVDKTDLEQQ